MFAFLRPSDLPREVGGEVNINNFRYVDDTAWITDWKENLQEVLGRVVGAYEEKSMISNAIRTESMISKARTDCMVMSKKVKSECDIKVGNGDTEQVKRFKYLVSTVISGSKFEKISLQGRNR